MHREQRTSKHDKQGIGEFHGVLQVHSSPTVQYLHDSIKSNDVAESLFLNYSKSDGHGIAG